MRLRRSVVVVCALVIAAGAWSAALQRLPGDLARDKHSKPGEIIPLLKLKPGDRVVDIFGSGGYYSELLARVVGASGEVLLHNNSGFSAWGVNILNERFTGRSLANVTRHDSEIADLRLGNDSLDAALLVMAYHDMYVVPTRYDGDKYVPTGPPADAGHFLAQIHRSLKPGARLVIVDHAAAAGMNMNEALELHRIHESFAKSDLEAHGFRYVTSSNALRNPHDDHTMIVFDPDVKGVTDRFVLVFEKPRD